MIYERNWLNEQFKDTDLSGFLQQGKKQGQTGILLITKQNQEQLTPYLNIQTNSESGYEKIDLDNPIDVGSVDLAKYGKDYYEVTKDNKIVLKEGIGIMFQKTEEGDWDVYPNPSPYKNDNKAKVYTNIDAISVKENREIASEQKEILTGIPLIDDNIKMAYKGYGQDQDHKETMIRIDVLFDILKIQFDDEMIFKVLGENGFEQSANRKAYIAYNPQTKEFSQVINSINGKPIKYILDKNEKVEQNIKDLDISSKITHLMANLNKKDQKILESFWQQRQEQENQQEFSKRMD